MSALETSVEQVGHRVRTIVTGGRARHRARPADVANCVTYLDAVANALEEHGLLVDAIAIDGRKPISGRLAIRAESGEMIPGVGEVLSLAWQDGFGWSTTTHGPQCPPNGWFHLYADPVALPEIIANFVVTEVLPGELSSTEDRAAG